MKSQSLTITGRSFYKFRALMDASLEKAVEKMLAAGVSEGTVSGQISIKLDRSVNDETGEVTIRPRFVFNTTLSVPVKISEKDETNEDLVLFRDEKSGRLKVCENQVTMDDILANSEIVPDAESADMVVVNTCSVTAAAASDSRGKVRSAAKTGAQVVVTGCWSTMEPEAAAAMEGVSRVVPNAVKDTLPAQLLGVDPEIFDTEPLKRIVLPGIHARTRAFIKIQDGCDNHCTFCVTHLVRGKSRSVSKERVLRDVTAALRSDRNWRT